MARSDSSAQRLSDHIDQLDLALDQLAVADRNFDRFALMLIDNVVELTLHSFAQDKGYQNELWGRLGEPRHDPEAVKAALGRRFDAKARFAAKAGLVSTEVCESLLLLHSFRNTAYHQGKRHEGVLHSLAVFYFINACELAGTYEPIFWSSSSNDQISYRARKYLGELRWDIKEAIRNAFRRLAEVGASMEENLVGDLSTDMAMTIDRTDGDIQFVVDNIAAVSSGEILTRDQVVIDSQAWPLAWTDEGVKLATRGGCSSKLRGDVYHWLIENHTWQVNGDPIPGWKARLAALEAEKDYHRALKRYCDFMSQTGELRSQISEAAGSLDGEIQHRIDEARGK